MLFLPHSPPRRASAPLPRMARQRVKPKLWCTPPASTPAPNAWHRVASPGGYEWWYLDALDLRGPEPLGVVAIVYAGFPFTPAYFRTPPSADAAARDPFRFSPLPRDHAAVSLSITRGQDVLATTVHEFGIEHFAARTRRTEVRVGPNRFGQDPDGSFRIAMDLPTIALGRRMRSPGWNQHTRLALRFTPIADAPCADGVALDGPDGGHHWFPTAPRCAVSGQIECTGEGAWSTTFAGLGYHDHNLGTRRLDHDFRDWFWARLAGRDAGVVFYDRLQPSGGRHRLLAWQAGPGHQPWVRAHDVQVRVVRRRVSLLGLTYPSELELHARSPDGASAQVRLVRREVVDNGPFYLRFIEHFSGQLTGPDGRVVALDDLGIAEYLYPSRLRWGLTRAMLGTRLNYTA